MNFHIHLKGLYVAFFDQLLLIMKLALLLTFVSVMQVRAVSLAQTVTVNARNVPLNEVMRTIQSQTGYLFFLKGKEVAYTKVNVHFENEDVHSAMDKLTANLPLTWEMEEGTIVIKPTPTPVRPATPVTKERLTQQREVTGRVTDASGQGLQDVTVAVQGTAVATVTDAEGNYRIPVPDDAGTLVFRYIGFTTAEQAIGSRTRIDVQLQPSLSDLDEVIVVGYGTQKKGQVTASVSTLDGDAITESPVANINNSIAGRVSGVLAFQGSGEPGADAANIRIRGIGTTGSNSEALTIVDGVPRDFSQLNPNEIETITVLKDAAAIAPYGLAGANGVVLVTTKRGKEGTIDLSYNGWYGLQRPTRYPDYLDAYEFASTLNVARANAGLAPQYTQEELQKYKDQSDPDHYPDHDWVKEVIDFRAPMTSHNLTFSGGTDKIRFFSALGYLYQQGSVDVINFSKYSLATNVDVNATKSTLVSLDVKARLEATKNPGAIDGTGIYTQVTKHPPLFSDQLSFTNGLPGHSLLPSIYNSGYDRQQENVLYSQLSIEQQIPSIPGLSLKGVFAYDKSYQLGKQWQTPYVYYQLNAADEFEEVRGGVTAPRLNQAFDQRVNTTLQGYITYVGNFGNHGVNFLAVAERREGDNVLFDAERINYQVNLDELDLGSAAKADLDNGGSSSSSKQMGFVYRASYNYSGKYMAEFSGRYDGHYYFAPGKRFVFFPAVSLGWRLSEEPFMENIDWINDLKLRGSYGKSGNLAGGPFQYLSSYGVRPGYIFGGTQVQGAFERNEPNRNITWETAKKLDIGIEGSVLNNRLRFEFDVFSERRSDMLVSPSAAVPLEYGIGLSQVNGGVMDNRGFDLSLSTFNQFENGLTVDVGVTVSYAKNKLVQIIEGADTYDNPERRRTGRPLGTQFGYKALGLFQSQEEIDNWATQFGTLQPGDIKYADMNNDGRIDANDEVVIGDPAFPQLIYGVTGNLSWRGFDLSMLWQGADESSFLLTNEASNPFFNGAKIFREQLDYWTPENRDATYPVIMPTPTPNSTQTSSWWIRDGRYLRLKNLEVGYAIPSTLTQKINVGGIRLFVAGQNLLTFSSESYLDPEIGVGGGSRRARYYFQQKVYTFGLNVNF